MVQLTALKIVLSFTLALKIRLAEDKWWKEVFFQKDAVQAALFTAE